jgi:hypothetical protein
MMIFQIVGNHIRYPKKFKDLSYRLNMIPDYFGGLSWAIRESIWIRERYREYFQLLISLQNPECDIPLRNEVARDLLNELWHSVRSRSEISDEMFEDIKNNGLKEPIIL